MGRRPFIAANWKMNMTHLEAIKFIQDFEYNYENKNDCEVAICPPFTALRSVKTIIESDNLDLKLGAQNMFYHESGAYTGEVSPRMLKALGVDYVIIGHSERRQIFGETDEDVNRKIKMAFKFDLKPIMCIGESLSIREEGKAEKFVIGQLVSCLKDMDEESEENIANITIAYEPIWAIGTGRNATPEDANEMCKAIRQKLKEMFGLKLGERIRIQYGGSVKSSNISGFMNMPEIDGALVGGASLKVEEFIAIINY